MSFSSYVTKRFILSKRDSKFISVISFVAIAGISLGVATLIIALSILNGFQSTITEKIIDFGSHLQIQTFEGNYVMYDSLVINRLEKQLGENLLEFHPSLSGLVVISSKKIQEGITLKGITSASAIAGLKSNFIEGKIEIDTSHESMNEIIIGKKLANKLLIKVGDKVTLFTLTRGNFITSENLPNIEQFIVAGIYQSGLAEYDDVYAYTDLSSAQSLFGIGKQVSGFDIKLKSLAKLDSLTNYLNANLRYPLYARNIYQSYRNIFTWIDLQKKPIPIILGLIIIVAVFNIISTLLMIVLEKTSSVGILKSLGSNKNQLVTIFLYYGGYLAIAGIFVGNIIAGTLLFLQKEFNIISLPSEIYFMSTVPIEFGWINFIGVSLLTFILCITAAYIPSLIASRIDPIKTLRFE